MRFIQLRWQQQYCIKLLAITNSNQLKFRDFFNQNHYAEPQECLTPLSSPDLHLRLSFPWKPQNHWRIAMETKNIEKY